MMSTKRKTIGIRSPMNSEVLWACRRWKVHAKEFTERLGRHVLRVAKLDRMLLRRAQQVLVTNQIRKFVTHRKVFLNLSLRPAFSFVSLAITSRFQNRPLPIGEQHAAGDASAIGTVARGERSPVAERQHRSVIQRWSGISETELNEIVQRMINRSKRDEFSWHRPVKQITTHQIASNDGGHHRSETLKAAPDTIVAEQSLQQAGKNPAYPVKTDLDIERMTDQVVKNINRRIISQRERLGRV